jgi:oxalate decarboxylase
MHAPATDIITQPFFWSSFNISPIRQQLGGWAREVTGKDFAISDAISGVNMSLAPGGIPNRRMGDYDTRSLPYHDN